MHNEVVVSSKLTQFLSRLKKSDVEQPSIANQKHLGAVELQKVDVTSAAAADVRSGQLQPAIERHHQLIFQSSTRLAAALTTRDACSCL